jgi:hypothetical protein
MIKQWPFRLRVQFLDSSICRNGGAFFGAAIFCRNKSQDRRALPTRGWLNNGCYVGTPASGFPLKSNNPVVRRFSHCRPFYCTVREEEADCLFRRISTAATDILQLGGGSSVFRDEWVFVCSSRYIVFNSRGLFHFRRRRRIVTSESPDRALDRAAVWSPGESALRECAERQYCENRFHLISFAGDTIPRIPAFKTGVDEVLNQLEHRSCSILQKRAAGANVFKCASPITRQMLTLAIASLFLFARREGRLPSCGLLAWRCGNCLDLLFFGFLGLPIAFLLAFGHVDLLKF